MKKINCLKSEMRVKRHVAVLKKMSKNDPDDDGYVVGSCAKRVSYVWELTKQIWFIKGEKHAQQRLQRHVATLIRRKS